MNWLIGLKYSHKNKWNINHSLTDCYPSYYLQEYKNRHWSFDRLPSSASPILKSSINAKFNHHVTSEYFVEDFCGPRAAIICKLVSLPRNAKSLLANHLSSLKSSQGRWRSWRRHICAQKVLSGIATSYWLLATLALDTKT